MKRILASILIIGTTLSSFAGNPDRTGQAGASELLINPWGCSSGWNGLNTANVHGLEAMNQNIAGLAFTNKTDVMFSRTMWMQGSGININAFGMAQKVGSNGGVIGFDVMNVDFGDIQITTTSLPEGGIGTFSPTYLNVGLSYAKTFSNSIYGGIVMRGISESISNVTANGIALDAGIQYVTGSEAMPDKVKFGIALRNIGTPMRFGGDGLSFQSSAQEGSYTMNVEERSEKFELPSLLNIGASYDIHLGSSTANNKLTLAGNFTSNSFSKDQLGAGAEFNFKDRFMLRAGYNYQSGIFSTSSRSTVLTGISGGFSFNVPLKDNGPQLGIDYAYRTTNPYNGSHTLGVRVSL